MTCRWCGDICKIIFYVVFAINWGLKPSRALLSLELEGDLLIYFQLIYLESGYIEKLILFYSLEAPVYHWRKMLFVSLTISALELEELLQLSILSKMSHKRNDANS